MRNVMTPTPTILLHCLSLLFACMDVQATPTHAPTSTGSPLSFVRACVRWLCIRNSDFGADTNRGRRTILAEYLHQRRRAHRSRVVGTRDWTRVHGNHRLVAVRRSGPSLLVPTATSTQILFTQVRVSILATHMIFEDMDM